VHRIGRTARAGNTGTAVTFVDWDDMPRWSLVNKALDLGIPEPQETYSTSEHLYSDLDIPEGTGGVLPRTARTRAGLDAEAVEDLGETGKRPADSGGRDRRGGTSGRDADRRSDAGETRPRRQRQRRRTRGGQPVDGGTSAPAAADDARPESGDAPRRRRRRRGGRGRGGADNATSATAES
jgi:superfamily II DNA/RNA helicase